jgi:hypothetical protein
MKTIVGLFEQPEAAEHTVAVFERSGFASASVQTVGSVRALWQHLGCTPAKIVATDFGIGAAIGIALYSFFGLLVAVGEVAMGFGQTIAIGALLVFVGLGVFVGGVLGAMFGLANAEQETRLYLNGIRSGGMLFVVRTADEHVQRAVDLLHEANAEGVKICRRTSDQANRHGLFGNAASV